MAAVSCSPSLSLSLSLSLTLFAAYHVTLLTAMATDIHQEQVSCRGIWVENDVSLTSIDLTE